jgi:hypothetical protein
MFPSKAEREGNWEISRTLRLVGCCLVWYGTVGKIMVCLGKPGECERDHRLSWFGSPTSSTVVVGSTKGSLRRCYVCTVLYVHMYIPTRRSMPQHPFRIGICTSAKLAGSGRDEGIGAPAR